ncbi:MAG: dihydropteroate synthase [Planctomycetota bacterium]
MDLSNFVIVGENIHCTRIVKAGGSRTKQMDDGRQAVSFKHQGESRRLPIPENWGSVSPAYTQGKVKHIALAIYQATEGDGEDKQAGIDYLCWAAERQIRAGATFLDVNVDEYSNDLEKNQVTMTWLVEFYGSRYDTPLSIDSSKPEILRAGLEACRRDIASPMINSISLERPEVKELAARFETDNIVSAAGPEGIPNDVEGRMANFKKIVGLLEEAGIPREKMHLDPLVLPVSVDGGNGKAFLEATSVAAKTFEGVHLNGGLSNISFGMPNRELLNQVFLYLCIEAGTDGGIIDPVKVNVKELASIDTDSEAFKLARAVLVGEDAFGMNYITAHREGKL